MDPLEATAPPRPGPLIAIEGLDGSGKTTLTNALTGRLRAQGQDVILTGRNDTRELYDLQMRLSAAGDLSPEMSCIWGGVELAARSHYVIQPALSRGTTVLAAKYLVTAFAQALARGHSSDFVRRIYDFATAPELVLYIDVTPETCLSRKRRNGDGVGFFEAGLDMCLDLPLGTALKWYTSGQLPRSVVEESFLRFQSQLRKLHDDILTEYHVVYFDAALAPEDLAAAAAEALVSCTRSSAGLVPLVRPQYSGSRSARCSS